MSVLVLCEFSGMVGVIGFLGRVFGGSGYFFRFLRVKFFYWGWFIIKRFRSGRKKGRVFLVLEV